MKKGNEVKVVSDDAPEEYKGKKGIVWQVGTGVSDCILPKGEKYEMCEVKFDGMPNKVWVPSTALELLSEGSPDGIFNCSDEVEEKLTEVLLNINGVKEKLTDIFSRMTGYSETYFIDMLCDLDLSEDSEFEEVRKKLNESFGINYVANIGESTSLIELSDNICDLLGIEHSQSDEY